MWINDFWNILNNTKYEESSFDLTDDQVILAKQYILQYIEVIKLEFDNYTSRENKSKMEKFPHNDIMHFLLKAIIVMKNNWAKNIDDLHTLENNIKKEELQSNPGTSKKIDKLNIEAKQQQEKDLLKAQKLSEQIKGAN